MAEKMNVTFWGVRGSYPVAGIQVARFGGNTACVAVQAGEQVIILDAGTGIIGLGKELLRRGLSQHVALFFSHLHHDHTQGLPFFPPAFMVANQIHLFGPALYDQDLEAVLHTVISPPVFPVRLQDMKARLVFHNLSEAHRVWLSPPGKVQIFSPGQVPASNLRPDDTVEVRLLQSYAHPGGVMLYRITWRDQAVVYATDTEGYVSGDRRLIAFAKDADLLIHDAQYTHEHYCGEVPGLPATQGWGHSTTQIACELAAAAGVHQLALFHHDPGYDDDRIAANETLAKALFPNSLAAREGLKLEVGHVIEYPNATSSVQYRYRKSSGQSPTTPFVTGST